MRYVTNSVIVSAIVVAANLVFNALAAYALTLRFRGKRAIILLLLSCMLIPFQATIIPAYLITKDGGKTLLTREGQPESYTAVPTSRGETGMRSFCGDSR